MFNRVADTETKNICNTRLPTEVSQPAIETPVEASQPQFPMEPPRVEVMSDWNHNWGNGKFEDWNGNKSIHPWMLHRWIKINGFLAIESETSMNFSVVTFVPPEIATELEAKYKNQAEAVSSQPQQ